MVSLEHQRETTRETLEGDTRETPEGDTIGKHWRDTPEGDTLLRGEREST